MVYQISRARKVGIALVSVTSQDIVNLETALNARVLRDDVRIVLRLTDDDLAERLQKTISNTVSRSVPYLAAPAFATAMLEHQVLRTIAVGRHVLLIADVRVADQAGLAGSSVRDTEQAGQARVLALQPSGSAGLDWSPARGHLLAAGDRLIVLATRKGLERFISVHEPQAPRFRAEGGPPADRKRLPGLRSLLPQRPGRDAGRRARSGVLVSTRQAGALVTAAPRAPALPVPADTTGTGDTDER